QRFLINEGRAVRGNNGGNHAIIEKPGPRSYLVEDPRLSFQDGRFLKVPMMIGVTKHEGSFFLGNYSPKSNKTPFTQHRLKTIILKCYMNSTFMDFILERNNATNNTDYLVNDFLKATLQFSGIDDTTGAITDVFQDKYFRVEEIGNFTAMVPGLVDICGVTLLKACTLQQARRNAHVQSTFLYTFNYRGQYTKFGYGDDAHHYPFPGGVAHSNDLLYLFPNTEGSLNSADREVAKTVVELWTSFASNGQVGILRYFSTI
ncbi:juvenile hormone esterase-like, partial [Homalodisca vitripennis]|uniref:juvenile hormone esterase-like n=1 Tax=Homalodisca vitripennis TaxID=197043 RepID=UPI001EEBA7F0